MGSIMTCWKLMVASIFEFKSTYQRKINQPQTNQIYARTKRRSGIKKKTHLKRLSNSVDILETFVELNGE